MQTVTTCPACSGEGTTITNKCGTCKGEGRVYGEETVSLDIPAGVQEGMQLSMSGKGNVGERSGPSGDLTITGIGFSHTLATGVADQQVLFEEGSGLITQNPE